MSASQSAKPHEIIVFDFDGTITTKDTFALFLRYYAGFVRWALNIITLLPIFLAYGLRIIDRNAVKSHVIKQFFSGADVAALQDKAKSFAEDVIPGLIRPDAQIALDERKKAPDTLYICSASISPYLNHWARSQNIQHVLATELEEDGSRYTGRIKGWNIWGEGKIRRILAEFSPNPVTIAEAFGDSRGDREMLHAAEVSHWRPFRLNEHE